MTPLRKLAELGLFEDRKLLPGLVVGLLAAALYTSAQIAIPLVTGSIVDEALLAKNTRALLIHVVLLLAAATVSTVSRGVQQTTFTWVAERGRAQLVSALLDRFYGLPLALFHRERSGRLHSLLTEDASNAARLTAWAFSEAAIGVLQLGLLLAVLALRYGQIVFAALILIPIYMAFPLLLGRPTRAAARRAYASTSEVNAALQESVQAAREVKIFGREVWAVDRVRGLLATDISRRVRLSLLSSVHGLQYAVYFLVASGVYWLGGLRVVEGTLSLGQLVALVALLAQLEGPVGRLTRLGTEYQRVVAAFDRIDETLGAEPPIRDTGSLELQPGGHRIRFEEVTFRYDGASRPVLEGVTFAAEPGQRLAIVGTSGAGKSTLVSLLARLHEPQQGRILIDGRELADYSVRSLRREIGFVLQESMLFAGTVRENIRIGRLDASEEEIVASARAAQADGFIRELPEGYDTEIGERGTKLSGGQRQRIGIARVLLRNPGILVLDEAMSALDTESERWVREALWRLMEGRTTFLIAHRPSAFVDADRILVLEEGKVLAAGRHDELMATIPEYRKLAGERKAADPVPERPALVSGSGSSELQS